MRSGRSGSVSINVVKAACAAVLFSTMPAAQTELFEFRDFGTSSAPSFAGSAGDMDGDGTNDVLVSGSGYPTVHSGYGGALLLQLFSGFPAVPAMAIGDVTGDVVPDLLTGASLAFPVLQAYSGASGAVLYQVGAFPTLDLAAVGDLDGDTVPDFCFLAALSGGAPPQVCARSGANGGPLWNTSVSDSLLCIASLGADVTGDGVPEIVVGGATPVPNPVPFVRLLSGASGALIWGVPFAGESIAALGDMNGNLVPDVAALRSGNPLGSITILDGQDGTLIRSFPTAMGRKVASAGDIDGDGAGDLLLGNSDARDQVGTSTGAVQVYSGATGALLWTAFGKHPGEGFGSSVASLGDITGDGIPDVVAGTSNGGAARVLSGALLPNGLTLPVGIGCSPVGLAPNLTASRPVIGETFTTFVTNARTSSPAFALFSSIPSSPRTLANGCKIYTRIGAGARLGTGVTSPSGTWVLNTPVPYAPSLIGLELALQARIPGLPRYQYTNGLHLLVGL